MRHATSADVLKKNCLTASMMQYAAWLRFVWWVTMYNKVFIP